MIRFIKRNKKIISPKHICINLQLSLYLCKCALEGIHDFVTFCRLSLQVFLHFCSQSYSRTESTTRPIRLEDLLQVEGSLDKNL